MTMCPDAIEEEMEDNREARIEIISAAGKLVDAAMLVDWLDHTEDYGAVSHHLQRLVDQIDDEYKRLAALKEPQP